MDIHPSSIKVIDIEKASIADSEYYECITIQGDDLSRQTTRSSDLSKQVDSPSNEDEKPFARNKFRLGAIMLALFVHTAHPEIPKLWLTNMTGITFRGSIRRDHNRNSHPHHLLRVKFKQRLYLDWKCVSASSSVRWTDLGEDLGHLGSETSPAVGGLAILLQLLDLLSGSNYGGAIAGTSIARSGWRWSGATCEYHDQ